MARQEQLEAEFLTCNICFGVFTEPKTLACLHRFCEKCLHNCITALSSAADLRRGFHCPVCREFIPAPNPSSPPSQWASLLKTDFHLKNLIKFVESRKDCFQTKQLSAVEHPCSQHTNTDRDLYCVDCSKIICHLCAGTSHRGCNLVVTLTEAANDRRAKLDVALHHAWGKFEEALALRNVRDQCLRELETKKSTVEEEIKKQVQFLYVLVSTEESRLLEQLHGKYDAIKGEIALQVSQFEESLERMKNETQIAYGEYSAASNFELLHDGYGDEILTELQDMDIVDVTHYRRFFNILLGVKATFHKHNIPFLPMGDIEFSYDSKDDEDGHAQTTDLTTNTSAKESLSSTNRVVETTRGSKFPPKVPCNTEVGAVSSNVRSSGVSTTEFPAARTRAETVKTRAVRADITASQPTTLADVTPTNAIEVYENASIIRTINTQFHEDATEPCLRDLIVVAPSNTVIVTDWSNQCIKSFHDRRERDTRLALGGKPWAITQMNDLLAAVSLPLSRRICIVKIWPEISIHKTFVSAKKYYGLSSLKGAMLVAGGGSDSPSVDIINHFGKVLKTFSRDNNGLPMFKNPAYVSVMPGMLILVSDMTLGAIVCISQKGEIKFHFQPDGSLQLREPAGVTSDLSGRIFVAESRGLLLLTPDGQLDRVLVRSWDDILQDPIGVALDSEGLVYITSNDEDITVLKIA